MTSPIDKNLYARMAKPYPDQKSAGESMKSFLEAVQVLREQHRIPELVCIVGANYLDEHGAHQTASTVISRGDATVTNKLFGGAAEAFVRAGLARAAVESDSPTQG